MDNGYFKNIFTFISHKLNQRSYLIIYFDEIFLHFIRNSMLLEDIHSLKMKVKVVSVNMKSDILKMIFLVISLLTHPDIRLPLLILIKK